MLRLKGSWNRMESDQQGESRTRKHQSTLPADAPDLGTFCLSLNRGMILLSMIIRLLAQFLL